MGDPAKRRRRAKEKAKESRKKRGVSPWLLLGKSGGECAVYVNANWRHCHLINMLAFRAGLHGGWTVACFLIDLECLGLKDAFVKDDCLKSVVLDRMRERGGVERINLEDARKWVAGAIRWTSDHEFRLPVDYEKAVMMLGGVGDWRAADVSGFAPEGKLRFIGNEEDLEKRLIGRSSREFIEGEGVEYMMGIDPKGMSIEDWPDDDEEAMGDEEGVMVDAVCQGLEKRVRKWLATQGREPAILLAPAAPMVIAAVTRNRSTPAEERTGAIGRSIAKSLELAPEELRGELSAAGDQILEFILAMGATELLEMESKETPVSGAPPMEA